jgi:hypothetical protein
MSFARAILVLLGGLLTQAAGLTIAAAEPFADDTVWLTSSERFKGELLSVDPRQGLVWKHPDIRESLPLPIKDVVKIRLGGRPVPAAKPSNPCLVRLANQDELEGDLAGFDGENLLLDTWYAGQLRIPRSGLDSVQPVVVDPRIVFQGPTNLAGWTLGDAVAPGVQSNAWTYSDGALVSLASGSVARDVKLPPVASIDFDLAWSVYLNIAIALYADSLQPIQLSLKDDTNAPAFSGFYSLQINANTANVLPVKKDVPLNIFGLGIAFLPGMDAKTSTHVTVRVNKAARTIFLYLDGVLIRQWQDPVETLGPGTCLRFVNQSLALVGQASNPVRLSNLVVTEWDGRLDLQTNIVSNPTNDVVRLLNRDAMAGTLTGIRAGDAQLSTGFGPVTVPLNRVEQVHFARDARRLLPRTPDAVKAQFARRGHLTLAIEGWEDGRLVANHPVFGRARFALAAFRQLEWPEAPAPAN